MKLELDHEKAPKTLEELEAEAEAKEIEEMKNSAAEEAAAPIEPTEAEEQFLFDMNNQAVQAAQMLTAGYLPPEPNMEQMDDALDGADVNARKVKSARTKKEKPPKETRGGKKGSPKKDRTNSMMPGGLDQLEGLRQGLGNLKDRSQSMMPGAQHAEFLTATPGKIKRERAGSIKMTRKGSARRRKNKD